MRFSLWLWPYGRWGGIGGMVDAARRAEEAGFHSISISDHTICPTGPEGDGLMAEWPDWAVLSSALAMATTRLRIVACVVIPYRHPVISAKQISTIDWLSHGRLTLAACVGWLEQEYAMLGVPFGRRGQITDEYLEAMRRLWTEDEPRFEGSHVSFSDLRFEPKCHQQPHVPIWIAGGDGPKSIGRTIRIGDGWMPMGNDKPAALGETIARIQEGVARAGRDPSALTFRYTIGLGESERALGLLSGEIARAGGGIESDDPSSTPVFSGAADEVAAAVERYAAAGFTELAINPAGTSFEECMDRVDWFAAEVLPLLGTD
jgi:probable F420-dependent oxidoreductase